MAKKTSHSPEKSSKAPADPPNGASGEASKTFLISNELGLHARAAAQFVKIASRFASEITVVKDSRDVNGKSIMGILMLAAAKGSKITVKAAGADASEALHALEELIQNKFGEQ
ncbi:MAG TPA: HPr family phosphocarrier protein [bacterium]|nr:HPr family phosphocarrier protein [bacterium]